MIGPHDQIYPGGDRADVLLLTFARKSLLFVHIVDIARMEEVKSLLQQAGLSRYNTVFEEYGYDSLSTLLSMGPADFEQLAVLTKILPGHLVCLKSRISTIRAQASTVATRNRTAPTGYSVPLIENAATATSSASSASKSRMQQRPKRNPR